jgi:RNA polymerase sigma factor (sigma-70 family)
MQLRARKNPVEMLEPGELDRQAPGKSGDEVRSETAELVHGALARLAPEQRMALELFELHELSIREVANVMGKAETAVRVQLHRARARMAEMLREAGLDPGEL